MMIKKLIKKSHFFNKYRELAQNRYLARRSEAIKKDGLKIISELYAKIALQNPSLFVDYGTLLGVIREKRIIMWDDDIDMGIIMSDIFSWHELQKIMLAEGYVKKHQFTYNGEITEQNYEKGFVSIDFFRHYEKEGVSISYVYDKDFEGIYPSENFWDVMEFKTPGIVEVDLVNIDGYDIPVPNNNVDYLSFVYGKDWQIPNPNWKTGDGPATTKLTGEYAIAEFFE